VLRKDLLNLLDAVERNLDAKIVARAQVVEIARETQSIRDLVRSNASLLDLNHEQSVQPDNETKILNLFHKAADKHLHASNLWKLEGGDSLVEAWKQLEILLTELSKKFPLVISKTNQWKMTAESAYQPAVQHDATPLSGAKRKAT
jgi:hypothetical protein